MTTIKDLDDWFEHISQEIIWMFTSRRIFKELHGIIQTNSSIQKKEQLFLVWMKENYTAAMAMGIRRLIDDDRRTRSFVRLLRELKVHSDLISKKQKWALFLYPIHRSMDIELELDEKLEEKFNSTSLSEILEQDIAALKETAKTITDYANQSVAHSDRTIIAKIPYPEHFERAMSCLEDILAKYFELFRGATLITSPLIVPDVRWKDVFYEPWIEVDKK